MSKLNPNDKCGKYTVNYNIDDLIEVYTNKLVLKLVKERYPELYKEARKQIKALAKNKKE
jgi:hypothetical protein